MVNSCGACGRPATKSWQRHATSEELRAAIADPRVPSVGPGDTTALVIVLACDEHAFPPVLDADGAEYPSDLSARVHDSTCAAPAEPCACPTEGR